MPKENEISHSIASEEEGSKSGEDVPTDLATDPASNSMSEDDGNEQQGTGKHIQQPAGTKGSVC